MTFDFIPYFIILFFSVFLDYLCLKLENNNMKRFLITGYALLLISLSACRTEYALTGIKGEPVKITSAYDRHPNPETATLLAHYKGKVDSIMLRTIGTSESILTRNKPESPLSNLIADILRESATPYIGKAADVALMNMGGIRNDLPAGEISYGNIFEIAPFENTLCIIKMKGTELLDLFRNIAAVHGEGISGAQLTITSGGELVKVILSNGKEIVPDNDYYLATIDYLAEGNDKMHALKNIPDKQYPSHAILRDLIIKHIETQTRLGKKIQAKTENRIIIQ